MSRLSITDLPLSGLKRIERQRLEDSRGFLSRLFCAEELADAGWHTAIAQINHTYTRQQGTVRGFHFQKPPHAEMKLISCLRGKVWDVAIDLRRDSTNFLQWHAECLSEDNGYAMLIPEGFAHGFQALSDDVELLYCHSTPYNPLAEAGLNVKDPQLNIQWPLPIQELSPRDIQHPMLNGQFTGLTL